jgi:hypothetical protein
VSFSPERQTFGNARSEREKERARARERGRERERERSRYSRETDRTRIELGESDTMRPRTVAGRPAIMSLTAADEYSSTGGISATGLRIRRIYIKAISMRIAGIIDVAVAREDH